MTLPYNTLYWLAFAQMDEDAAEQEELEDEGLSEEEEEEIKEDIFDADNTLEDERRARFVEGYEHMREIGRTW